MKTNKDLEWLVKNRSAIEKLTLNLYLTQEKLDIEVKLKYQPLFGHLVGASFSLWRSVFHASEKRDRRKIMNTLSSILRIVIETNTVGFPQQVKTEEFTAGYYTNHAIYALQKVFSYKPMLELIECEIDQSDKDIKKLKNYANTHLAHDLEPQKLWELAFNGLQMAVGAWKKATSSETSPKKDCA